MRNSVHSSKILEYLPSPPRSRIVKVSRLSVCILLSALAAACGGGDDSPTAPGASPSTLAAPALNSPADAAQLTTLRPTFIVTNSTSAQSGTRTYEFQISDR